MLFFQQYGIIEKFCRVNVKLKSCRRLNKLETETKKIMENVTQNSIYNNISHSICTAVEIAFQFTIALSILQYLTKIHRKLNLFSASTTSNWQILDFSTITQHSLPNTHSHTCSLPNIFLFYFFCFYFRQFVGKRSGLHCFRFFSHCVLISAIYWVFTDVRVTCHVFHSRYNVGRNNNKKCRENNNGSRFMTKVLSTICD